MQSKSVGSERQRLTNVRSPARPGPALFIRCHGGELALPTTHVRRRFAFAFAFAICLLCRPQPIHLSTYPPIRLPVQTRSSSLAVDQLQLRPKHAAGTPSQSQTVVGGEHESVSPVRYRVWSPNAREVRVLATCAVHPIPIYYADLPVTFPSRSLLLPVVLSALPPGRPTAVRKTTQT